MVLPDGFALPALELLVPLVVLLVALAAILWTLGPPVTDRTVLALVPWMVLGSTFHVLYQIDAAPGILADLFGAPTVYLTTAALAGLVWIVAIYLYGSGLLDSIEGLLGMVGVALFGATATAVLFVGWDSGTFSPFWPVVSIVLAALVSVMAWLALANWFEDVAAVTGATGVVVVVGHTLDGVSTAIGYDILGAAETVPASRAILEAAESLPTYDLIGAGWLFVLVKVGLSLVVVGLFADFVREDPKRARLLLALVAAVGLGPAVHNVLLFTVA
ncbi:DUF63 family protein [Halobacteria archaeon AArc-dxtr1]|nr:DUF63 family protein [Halobacteria archaeon AArc-dxtr1]